MKMQSIKIYSDLDILNQCLQNNAYDILFVKYYKLVKSTIRKTCKRYNKYISELDIEDILMDVFENLMKGSLKKYNPNYKKENKKAIDLKGWVILITSRKTMTYLRDRKNFVTFSDYYIKGYTEEERFLANNDIQYIEKNLHHLPTRDRLVFKMRYLQDNDRKQIAQHLNISLDAVDTALYRARKKLKELL